MMHKVIFSLTLIGISMACALKAYADTKEGGLVVTGNMVAQSCVIPDAELNKTVTFKTINILNFGSVNVDGIIPGTTQPLAFHITGCTGGVGQRVQLRFDYQRQTGVTDGYLANTGDSHGVLVAINKKDDPTKILSGGIVPANTNASGAATIEVDASLYKATQPPYTAGSINSTLNVALVNP